MTFQVAYPYTPETRFSEPRFSEILNLMNELWPVAPFFIFYSSS